MRSHKVHQPTLKPRLHLNHIYPPSVLVDRVLWPCSDRHLVVLDLDICEACGGDAALEVVDGVEWTASARGAAEEEGAVFFLGEYGICWHGIVVAEDTCVMLVL